MITGMAWITQLQLGESNIYRICLIFCISFFAYNFIRIVSGFVSKGEPLNERQEWVNRNKSFLILLSSLSLLSALALILELELWWHPALWISAAICLAYALPVVSNSKGIRARDLPFLKIFLIALSWALICTWLALENFNFKQAELLVGAHWLLFLVAYTIPFDIRDISVDNTKMSTIPQVLGLAGARNLGLIFLAGFEIILWIELIFYHSIHILSFVSLLLTALVLALLIMGSSQDKKDMYYSFWVEGVPSIAILAHILFCFFI